jgi:Zn-dependent peptidase ImmA (M78 family)/transcriptional regulator with XRE-family HTH domain
MDGGPWRIGVGLGRVIDISQWFQNNKKFSQLFPHHAKNLNMPAVKPEILIWARETAGLSLEDAARRLGIHEARGISGEDRLAAVERGETPISRPTLLKMSKQYRRPLLTFYLDAPPKRGDRGEDFRTLPEKDVTSEGLVDAMVRDIRARQSMVRAILEDDEEAMPLPFIGSVSMDAGVPAVVQSIRQAIGLDLADFRFQATPDSAFSLLRQHVEEIGVFVLLAGNLGSHHTDLDVEVFRGFALADNVAPFIVINDKDARPAWSFTLLHELAHLWLGATGVSGSYGETRVERFCNEVASAYLLPDFELAQIGIDKDTDDATLLRIIDEFAVARHLSRSMVAYRLRNANVISDEKWRGFRVLFRNRWREGVAAQREKARLREGGPNYYIVRRHKLGAALLKLVARHLSGGSLSPTKAGKVLGVKPRSVDALLSGGALSSRQAA